MVILQSAMSHLGNLNLIAMNPSNPFHFDHVRQNEFDEAGVIGATLLMQPFILSRAFLCKERQKTPLERLLSFLFTLLAGAATLGIAAHKCYTVALPFVTTERRAHRRSNHQTKRGNVRSRQNHHYHIQTDGG